jgi:uncharacterized protein (DUF2141 family)
MSGKDPGSPFILKINADPAKVERKSVRFMFTDVPGGAYAISCYQDVNGNGKLDMGLFGPVEPWGFYGVRPVFAPVFKDEAFELNGDLTNIIIDVK